MGGSQFTISGTVTLETAQAAAGAKEVRAEIQNLSQAGIAGFEAAQQKVIELTKRIAELRTQLLQTNDPAAQAKLNTALAQSQKEFSAARGALRGMSLESRDANQKIQMLAASLGVQLPQGLGQVLARLPTLQAAMAAAFSITIVAAFAAGLIALIPRIRDLALEWGGFTQGMRDQFQAALAANEEALRKFTTTGIGNIFLAETNARIGALQREKEALEKAYLPLPTEQISALVRLREITDQIGVLDARRMAQLGQLGKVAEEAHKKAAAGAAEAAKKAKELFEAEWKVNWAYEHRYDAATKAAVIEIEYAAKAREGLAQLPPLIDNQAAGLKNLPPIIQEIYANWDLANEAMAKDMKAQTEAAEKLKHQQEQLASSIEQFIDRVFIQARSLSDVFHQFLMQMLSSFVKWISQMLASWLQGLGGLTGQGTGAGGWGSAGGLLGNILNRVFHLGSGAGGGVTSAVGTSGLTETGGMIGSFPAGSLGGYPTGGSAMTVAGGTTATSAGTWKGLPTQAGAYAGPIAAAAAYGFQLLRETWGGHGGLFKGGLGGMLFYGMGAGEGLLAGLFLGALGRGKAKRKATGLEQGFEAAADEVYEQFKKFQVDYDSALSSLQALISQGQQTLTSAGLGKWGRLGAENLTRSVQQEIAAVQSLQKQREANAAVMAGMTAVEFHGGGQVLGVGSGILAIVHPGEFVMRREAVQALGAGFLSTLNRAPSFAEGGAVGPPGGGRTVNVNFYTTAFDGPSVDAWWRRNQGRIATTVRRAVRDGAL